MLSTTLEEAEHCTRDMNFDCTRRTATALRRDLDCTLVGSPGDLAGGDNDHMLHRPPYLYLHLHLQPSCPCRFDRDQAQRWAVHACQGEEGHEHIHPHHAGAGILDTKRRPWVVDKHPLLADNLLDRDAPREVAAVLALHVHTLGEEVRVVAEGHFRNSALIVRSFALLDQ